MEIRGIIILNTEDSMGMNPRLIMKYKKLHKYGEVNFVLL